MTAAGLLLAKLAPEPDRGKPLPNGMTQLVLRIEKGALKYSWPHLTACLARSLDARDTIASISRILEELSLPMTQVVADIPPPSQAGHTDTDSSMSKNPMFGLGGSEVEGGP